MCCPEPSLLFVFHLNVPKTSLQTELHQKVWGCSFHHASLPINSPTLTQPVHTCTNFPLKLSLPFQRSQA